MLKLFNTNNPFILILFLVIGIIFWLSSFLHPVIIIFPYITTPFYNSIYSQLSIIHFPLFISIAVIAAFILLYVEAIILNHIITQNKLFAKTSYLPVLVYLLLMSSIRSLQTLTPVLISNLFLLISFQKIFSIYDKEEPFAQIFNIGFLTSIASLFYFPAIYFIVVIWVSFLIYRIYSLRQWLISLIGLLTPYIFIVVWLFWNDRLGAVYFQYYNYIKGIRITSYNLNTQIYAYVITIGVLTILSLIKVFSRNREKLLKTRSSYEVLLWFLLISVSFIFVGSDKQTSIFEIAFIPLSVFLSNYFQRMKKQIYNELAFILFLILIFASRFYF